MDVERFEAARSRPGQQQQRLCSRFITDITVSSSELTASKKTTTS